MKKNEDFIILGKAIKLERHKREMSQNDFAELTQIGSYQHLGNIEKGEVDMRASTLFAILRALNLKLEDLIDLHRQQ